MDLTGKKTVTRNNFNLKTFIMTEEIIAERERVPTTNPRPGTNTPLKTPQREQTPPKPRQEPRRR